jgi:hypothetical protein
MNKDVIYIDIEDDITAIIGRIKSSKEKIVALVPPKRIGVLQSAVNLKLLARSAEHSHKHLVIITSNKALIALSAVAMIPIAKNLHSKPELAEIEVLDIDETDDIIDGSQLPVGELVRTVDSTKTEDDVEDIIEDIDIESDIPRTFKGKSNQKSAVKVPDFSRFRKKVFIGGVLGIILIGFLVWAIGYAPAAKIIITTKTSSAPVSGTLKLTTTGTSDINKNVIQTVSKQIKKDISVDFEATGQEDVGNKATGTMEVTRISISSLPLSVPAGTTFTSGDNVFESTEATTLAATQVGPDGPIQDSATVKVVSTKPGDAHNVSARSYDPSVNGIYAYGSDMAGGTTKMARVVSADDIQKASQALVDLSTETYKQQLIDQFTNGESVIKDSFAIDRAAAVSVPAVGAEVTTPKAKLTSSTTFSMLAIAKSEIGLYLKNELNKQILDENNQRVYDDGSDKVVLSGYLKNDAGQTVNINATGQIGPKIDQDAIKKQSKGKRYGDVQSMVSEIKGVDNVDVKFSYFWVNTVPSDLNKIEIEIKLQNE